MTITADQVAQILTSAAVRRIAFTSGPTRVDSGGFAAVAEAVRAGTLRVTDTTPEAPGDAHYSLAEGTTDGVYHAADTFYLAPDFDPDSVMKCALLVHEATHAIEDGMGITLGVLDAEVAAYTAQAFYFLARGTTWAEEARRGRLALHRDAANPEVDAIITAAHAAANRIHNSPDALALTSTERANIRAAVAAHHDYVDRAADRSCFDGWG